VLAAVRPQPGEQDGWAPPPGLSGPGGLLDRVRAAGLTVTARIDGAPADLPAGLDLTAYRIVQEALTNTLKHARAQATQVNLCYSPAGLVLGGHRRRPGPRAAASSGSASRSLGTGRHDDPGAAVRCQALVRGGFWMILEARPDLQVIGEGEDGRQAVSLAR
jgi:hypothetical protein